LPNRPTVSVIICAHREDRWWQLTKSVASVEAQTAPPIEIIVCVDHNEKLLRKSEEYLGKERQAGAMPVIVLANKYHGHLASARNTGAEFATGELLAFLDDDAAADADWLERLTAPYDDERVGAVGGAPLPVFEVRRPRWFPHEFDWVFGCAYRGLPLTRAPLAHLIGANMSARRSALREVGGFHSDHEDDMDMCHRIAHAQYRVLYEPLAIVHHFVPATRTTWHYFWRKCYFANQGKVEVFANMQEAASLGAERAFVTRALTAGVLAEIRHVIRGDLYGLARIGAMIAGIVLAGLGHLSGRLHLRRSRQAPAIGWQGARREQAERKPFAQRRRDQALGLASQQSEVQRYVIGIDGDRDEARQDEQARGRGGQLGDLTEEHGGPSAEGDPAVGRIEGQRGRGQQQWTSPPPDWPQDC
jgi:GT2 family glycosyltransferase